MAGAITSLGRALASVPFLLTVILLLLQPLALLPSAGALQPSQDSWPQFRGSDDRLGVAASLIPDTNETLWTLELGDQVQGSFAVVDGMALVGCDDGNLYCLDADTGDELWRFHTDNVVQSTPLVSEGYVYFGSSDGHGYCLHLGNGSEVWSIEGQQFVASPALWNGTVYFADQYGNLYAVNATNGSVIWTDLMPLDVWASPTVVGGRLYVGDIIGFFRCYDATNGSLLWEREFVDGEVYSSALVHDGRVLVGTGLLYTLECLDALTGETVWTFEAGTEVYSSAAFHDGVVYCHAWDHLWAVPWEDPDGSGTITTDEALWSFRTRDEQGGSSPVVSGDRLVVGSDVGRLFCVDIADGSEAWNLSMPAFVYASPAVASGRVYVGSTGGRVACVGRSEVPRLYTTLEPTATVVEGGKAVDITISVLTLEGEVGGDPFMGYSATHGTLSATFGTVVEGTFKISWTAPDVTQDTLVTITATGELPGFEVVGAELQLQVVPAEEVPEPEVPTIAHPGLTAGVAVFLAIDALLAVVIVRGRRRNGGGDG